MIAAEVPAGPLCHIPARESPSVHQTGSRHSADLLNHLQVLVFPTENTNLAEVEMREDRPSGSGNELRGKIIRIYSMESGEADE